MHNMVDYVLGAPGPSPKVAGIENNITRYLAWLGRLNTIAFLFSPQKTIATHYCNISNFRMAINNGEDVNSNSEVDNLVSDQKLTLLLAFITLMCWPISRQSFGKLFVGGFSL